MSYGPNLSCKASRSLSRLAWAIQLPMTKAIEEIFQYLPQIIDSKFVCIYCKDRSKCNECYFKSKYKGSEPVSSKIKILLQKSGKKKKLTLNKKFF